jgi:hypothetical protein
MRIYDCIDNYIEEFVQSIRNSDGKIKKLKFIKNLPNDTQTLIAIFFIKNV